MIEVEHEGPALASWFVKPLPWMAEAVCHDETELFFDNDNWSPGRILCATCPVRVECGTQAMAEEQGVPVEYRAGLRAYMTPAQRESVERRGGLNGRDPMLLVLGDDGGRRVPPVPDDGDKWPRHLTTLARKVVRWIVEHVEIGCDLPTSQEMCKSLGCNPTPLRRVLHALVQDGTLDFETNAAGAAVRYTRRATPRAVGSWLPPHLRGVR